mmetsp:Transcript_23211/g.41336  ORF Transcript_23211/g.41336 Transcript_23211/m.41336 type:complete len:106 (+) Transcript_23211:44-361(+)
MLLGNSEFIMEKPAIELRLIAAPLKPLAVNPSTPKTIGLHKPYLSNSIEIARMYELIAVSTVLMISEFTLPSQVTFLASAGDKSKENKGIAAKMTPIAADPKPLS